MLRRYRPSRPICPPASFVIQDMADGQSTKICAIVLRMGRVAGSIIKLNSSSIGLGVAWGIAYSEFYSGGVYMPYAFLNNRRLNQ